MDKKRAQELTEKLTVLLEDNRYKTNRVDLQLSPGDLIALIDALDLAAVNEYQSCKYQTDGLRRRIRELEGTIRAVEEALGHE